MYNLVPFSHESLVSCDSVWLDPRRVRFPTEEVGRLFRGDRGAANPKRYVELVSRIVSRRPLLKSLGVDLVVRGRYGTQGDREYQTRCYSMDEIHDLAIYCMLPGARHYLHIYPKLKEAEILGRLSRPSPDLSRVDPFVQNLDAVLTIPDRSRERADAKKLLGEKLGKSPATVDRYLRKRRTGDIPPLRRGRSDKGSLRKFPADLQEKTRLILEYQPNISTRELQSRLDGKVQYSTLRRYRLALKLGH